MVLDAKIMVAQETDRLLNTMDNAGTGIGTSKQAHFQNNSSNWISDISNIEERHCKNAHAHAHAH